MGQHRRALQEEEDRDLNGEDGAEVVADGAATGSAGDADDLAAEQAAKEAAAALEAGRLLFAGPWGFVRPCHDVDQLPPAGPAEFAFAGRSNVGKSSLLNALTAQKGLAKASNTPGRTRALNLFAREDGEGPVIVDMPGYGYAKAPKTEVAAWTRLVFDYLRGRPGLKRVYLLIDARHGVKPGDEGAMDVMDEAAVSYQVVLTKADKANSGPARGEVAKAIARRPAAHPDIIVTSSAKGIGIPELRAAIASGS